MYMNIKLKKRIGQPHAFHNLEKGSEIHGSWGKGGLPGGGGGAL